jgi:hypothetical protein
MGLAANTLIADSLAPAVAISGAALMTMGLLNRLAHLGTRVRQLNQTMREEHNKDTPRLANVSQQVGMVLKRARMVRNALLFLYFAIGCMVFTAFGLALTALGVVPEWVQLPIWTFLLGLTGILIAVGQEITEVLLALKALKLDVETNHH